MKNKSESLTTNGVELLRNNKGDIATLKITAIGKHRK